MRSLSLVLSALTLFALVVTGVACGGDDNKTGNEGASGDGNGSGKSGDYPIGAREYAFDFNDKIDGGLVRLRLENKGRETHQAQVVRLNDGVTQAQFQAALQNPDERVVLSMISLAGGPNAVDAGGKQTTVSDLRAGQYALLCFVESDDGVPHLAKGMVKPFEVTAPAQAASANPPQAKANITLVDSSFLGTESIGSGKTTVQVTNGGPQPHEMTIIRLKEGLTVDQLSAVLTGQAPPPPGPPPIESAGGVAALSVGLKGWADLDLTAGNYALLCFVPDATTGETHAAKGMIKGLTVK
jgi:hypothetical protein